MLSVVYRGIRELKREKLIRKQLNLLVQLIELKIYKYDNWQLVISSNRLTCCSRLTDCLNALWNGICISRDWCEVGSWKRAVIWFLVSWVRFVLLSRFVLKQENSWEIVWVIKWLIDFLLAGQEILFCNLTTHYQLRRS